MSCGLCSRTFDPQHVYTWTYRGRPAAMHPNYLAELAALQRIARGTQAMTIYKPIQSLAATAAESAVKMARGQVLVARATTPNGKVDVPSILEDARVVTKENIVPIVVKSGFHTYDAIYSGVPEAQRPPRP